ncbi:DNA ligase 1-like [Leptopilina heterotoma]|uniref:DNA ligase 1-like n=1 Tax=Leptopilina heterotoma TaxID=63436 RepID=UPI001CA98808|nr:DNA ligase 1-like [Leptopilina heterotoma]
MESLKSNTKNDKIKIITDSLKSIKWNLTCRICEKLFVEPVTMNCGHSFCINCIESYLEFKRRCPTCKSLNLIRDGGKKTIHLQNLILGFEKLEESCLLDIKDIEEREDISTESEEELEQEEEDQENEEEGETEIEEEETEEEEDEEDTAEIKSYKTKKRYFLSSGSETTTELLTPTQSTSSHKSELYKTKKRYFPSFGLDETTKLLNSLSKTSSQVEGENENLISDNNNEMKVSAEENCENKNTKTVSINEKLSVTTEAESDETKKRFFPSFGLRETTELLNLLSKTSSQVEEKSENLISDNNNETKVSAEENCENESTKTASISEKPSVTTEAESHKTKKRFFSSFGLDETTELLNSLSKTSSQVEEKSENLISDNNNEIKVSAEENCENENTKTASICEKPSVTTEAESHKTKKRFFPSFGSDKTTQLFASMPSTSSQEPELNKTKKRYFPSFGLDETTELLNSLSKTSSQVEGESENLISDKNSEINASAVENCQYSNAETELISDFQFSSTSMERNMEKMRKSDETEECFDFNAIFVKEEHFSSEGGDRFLPGPSEREGFSDYSVVDNENLNDYETINLDMETINLVTEAINLNSENNNLESEQKKEGGNDSNSDFEEKSLPSENVGDLDPINSDPEIVDLVTETINLNSVANLNSQNNNLESKEREDGNDGESEFEKEILPSENVGDLEPINSNPDETIDLVTETIDLVTRAVNLNSHNSNFESEQQEESSDSESGVVVKIILNIKKSSH